MLPAQLIPISRLPRTADGEVNRARLLGWLNGTTGPDSGPASQGGPVRPRTPLEEEIAAIWCEVLGVERIGVHDNFFEIGGQSLMITQIYARLRHLLPRDLPLEKLFECPTVAALAELVVASEFEQQNADDIAELLEQIEGMSEEEANRVLRDEETNGKA
jgi:acyl carrier protein